MKVPLIMKIFQSVQNLSQNYCDPGLSQTVRERTRHYGLKRATRHEGHDHPEPALDHERAVGPEDVPVKEKRHGLGLSAHALEVGPRHVEIDRLDCYCCGVYRSALGLVDYGVYASPDLIDDFVGVWVQWVVRYFGFFLFFSHDDLASS